MLVISLFVQSSLNHNVVAARWIVIKSIIQSKNIYSVFLVVVAWFSFVWIRSFVTVWQWTANRIKISTEKQNNVHQLCTYLVIGLWNKLWFPSPHGNFFLRIRKCSYATNSSRGSSACSTWPKYAFNMPKPIAGKPTKSVNRLHNTTLAKTQTKN